MKKILLLMLVPLFMQAQSLRLTETQYGADKEFYFYYASCDSGTVTSGIIELADFNNDFDTYPLAYAFYVAENSSAYNPILGIFIEGRNSIGNWTVVDTLFTPDTVTSNTSGDGLLDMNTATYGVFPEYRVKTVATSDLGKTFTTKIVLYAYKRD